MIASAIRIPALATMISSRPNSATHCAKPACTDASSVTSILTASARRPVSWLTGIRGGLCLLDLDIRNDDVTALIRQPQTNRLPQPLRAARDERDFVL